MLLVGGEMLDPVFFSLSAIMEAGQTLASGLFLTQGEFRMTETSRNNMGLTGPSTESDHGYPTSPTRKRLAVLPNKCKPAF